MRRFLLIATMLAAAIAATGCDATMTISGQGVNQNVTVTVNR